MEPEYNRRKEDGLNGKKLRYQDIAEETGVSAATISRVVNGSRSIKEETRKRVIDSLAKHGFDTALITAETGPRGGRLIIFNVPNVGNPFYTQIVHGAKTAAAQRGCQLLLNEEHINDSTINNFLAMLRNVHAAGLIITNHVPGHLLKSISAEFHLVQCCEHDTVFDIPYVSIDDVQAAKNALEYLLSLGRKNIALINGPVRYKYARYRLKGYLESLKNAGIDVDDSLILQLPEISYDLAVSAVSNLLNAGKRPDAFFCVSDVFAAAVIKAASRFNLAVPKDIMVIGFDNVDISAMTNPTITTVNQPRFQLGFSSCELLVEHITNPKTPLHNILLATELIVRESANPGVSRLFNVR
jgi:LacI family repressor for deo operon, udp, cdd, tsx, nupC, and nupG